MRRWSIRFAVLSTLVTGTTLAFAFSSGPPASRTGAPAVGGAGAELACTACHTTFALNLPGATLEILDLPPSYEPNAVYTLRVRMSSTFNPPRRWGFQLTAVRAANGQGVGTFDIAGASGVQVVNGAGTFSTRRYIQHTTAGTFDNNNGPVEWTFRWQAPSSDLGRVFFFAAGNAANSSDTNAGDHIYTARDTMDINPLLDAPAPFVALDVLDAARPNPFVGATALSFSLAQGGPVDLSIFDPQGRRVRSLARGEQPAGRTTLSWDGRRDDGTAAEPGVYFVRLNAPASPAALVRRLVRVR